MTLLPYGTTGKLQACCCPVYDKMAHSLSLQQCRTVQVLCEATGSQEKTVKAKYKASGDLGSVAATLRQSQTTMVKKKALTVPGVHKSALFPFLPAFLAWRFWLP